MEAIQLSTSNKYNLRVREYQKYSKRIFDIVFSIAAILFLLPINLLVSFVLLINKQGILFKQTRTGLNNQPFTIYKFKTMRDDMSLEQCEHQYQWQNGVPDNFVFKSSSNPRTTKLGVFLRKYSIDELPQFFNVLKGEMSIVGPRPEIPQITQYYNDYQQTRLQMKPGITGYAQVNGRSTITNKEKIDFDIYYIQNYSFILDMKIVIRTVLQCIFPKGAI